MTDQQHQWDAELAVEFRRRIHGLTEEIYRLRGQETEAKLAWREVVRRRREAQLALEEAIAADARPTPLLDWRPPAEEAPPAAPPSAPGDWHERPVEQAGLSALLLAHLSHLNVRTLGALADLVNDRRGILPGVTERDRAAIRAVLDEARDAAPASASGPTVPTPVSVAEPTPISVLGLQPLDLDASYVTALLRLPRTVPAPVQPVRVEGVPHVCEWIEDHADGTRAWHLRPLEPQPRKAAQVYTVPPSGEIAGVTVRAGKRLYVVGPTTAGRTVAQPAPGKEKSSC